MARLRALSKTERGIYRDILRGFRAGSPPDRGAVLAAVERAGLDGPAAIASGIEIRVPRTPGRNANQFGRRAIRGRADVSAEEAMTPGPSTIRPSARLEAVVERMRRHSLTSLPVTRSEGRLVGLVTLRDAEEALRRL